MATQPAKATIYVSGAPGNIGTELVKLLSARGERVRALVHKPEKVELLRFPGVETVVGDLADRSSLDRTLQGVDRVFVNSAGGPPVLDQRNLIDAAKSAGVRHIVKFTWLGASDDSAVWFGRLHAQVERHLRDSGVPHTMLRGSFFMQNILEQAPAIAGQNAFYASAGEGKISVVDTRDIAAVAASVLTEPGNAGRDYTITGPQALSYADMAEIISRVTGRPIQYVNLSGEQFGASLRGAGLPDWVADGLVTIAAFHAAGGGSQVSDVVEKVGRKKPTTFEQFVRDFAGAFEARKVA